MSYAWLMWRDMAACLGMDTEIFFPRKGGTAEKAKEVCSGCPVRAECLDDALRLGDETGVRGGLTASDRRRLPRRSAPG